MTPALRELTTKKAADLWFIKGKAYDLEPWYERHPGGKEALVLAMGTNCTGLFMTYHLMAGPTAATMENFEVEVSLTDPEMVERLAPSLLTFEEDGFWMVVAGRVLR